MKAASAGPTILVSPGVLLTKFPEGGEEDAEAGLSVDGGVGISVGGGVGISVGGVREIFVDIEVGVKFRAGVWIKV